MNTKIPFPSRRALLVLGVLMTVVLGVSWAQPRVRGAVTNGDAVTAEQREWGQAYFAATGPTAITYEEYERLNRAYMDAPNHPEVIKFISHVALVQTKIDSPASLQFVMVAQNQKLIEQNAEIIELLKAQSKAK